MMNVFLVMTFAWDTAYRGTQVSAVPPQPMPSVEVCEKVGAAYQATHKRLDYRCVTAP